MRISAWGGVGIFMKGHELEVWWCSEKGASLKYETVILMIVNNFLELGVDVAYYVEWWSCEHSLLGQE